MVNGESKEDVFDSEKARMESTEAPDSVDDTVNEGCDPKVLEFLQILEEYREKCEDEGNYLEAARASKQLDTLRIQEERRQTKALRARQLGEKQDVQIAHNIQFKQFNKAWDLYLRDFDAMSQTYIKQMTERHAQQLVEYQQKLEEDLLRVPPKYSRELLDWRQRQHKLAKQKKYAEAEKIKQIADEMESREKKKMNGDHARHIQQKEGLVKKQQQAELAALLKRIDCRRKEHLKQRSLDSKRLLQRNKNVQQVLESKQSSEAAKREHEIKQVLMPHVKRGTRPKIDTGQKTKKRKKRQVPDSPDGPGTTFLTEAQ